MGDDVRWVGNEGGLGRDTEWSATLIAPKSYTDKMAENARLGLNEMSEDLGSRALVAEASEAYWYPSEVDVSIRPRWFFHPEENDKVRSLANLVDIYFRSVGCNSVLLLNIPPDVRGLLHEEDVKRLGEFSEYLRATFAQNMVVKGDEYWSSEAGEVREYEVVIDSVVNTLLIQEDITRGQRVEEFMVELYCDGEWHTVAEATTIGYKRLLRFEESRPEKLRITIRGARGVANISNVGLYYAKPL
jgi:alpha-L-fucosidase